LPGYGVLQIVASITVVQGNPDVLCTDKISGVRDVIDIMFRLNRIAQKLSDPVDADHTTSGCTTPDLVIGDVTRVVAEGFGV